jgi:hypothetical protein
MRILDVEAIAPAEAAGLTPHIVAGEEVEAAFRSPTALVLFTGRRIVLIQREALLEERVETSSFSYRAMRQFAVLEGSGGEGRAAVKVWLGADPQPLHLRAAPGTDLRPLQRLLAEKLA